MDAATLLNRARRAAGLSQSAYAARVGVSQPVISAYERGHREPSLSTLHRLVAGSGQTLRVDLAWVGDGLRPAKDYQEHGERLAQVLTLADAIPRRGQPRALAMPRIVSTR